MTRIKQFFSENPERKALVSFFNGGGPYAPAYSASDACFSRGWG